jgi:ElaB/YqjD/DUF883 family membrane-anchored ribosome-binding protein
VTPPSYEEDINDRDPEIVQAKAAIARAREAVFTSVTALQRELGRAVDWRAWVARRPLQAVMVAFGAGLVLGLVRMGVSRRTD